MSEVWLDGDSLGVSDSCHTDPRVDVEESEDSVILEFSVGEITGGDCCSFTFAELRGPLGDREVVDKSTGEVIPVRTVAPC